MAETTRVTEKGQATIPKRLREKYGFEPGEEVAWVETDDGIAVKKATSAAARGMLVPETTSEAKRDEIADELGDSIRRRRDDNYAANDRR
jgi:AbrB family looped-hinge helix DNA binding protein